MSDNKLTLTEESFRLCMNALVKLPFTKTSKQVEPNMITIVSKHNDHDYEFQIWRDSDYDYSFNSSRGPIDPKTFNLDGTKLVNSGDYYIELTCGCDFVNPIDYV